METQTPTIKEMLDRVIRTQMEFTPEQQSLAWCPEPPYTPSGAHDCRIGGGCGLNFNFEDSRAQWRRARYRFNHPEKYTLVPFAYSYRCTMCRQEFEHTVEQHELLRAGGAA